MALSFPTWVLPLVGQLVSVVPGLIIQAETAFDGQAGNGDRKKEFVMASVKAMLDTQNMINKDLLTDAQEAAVLDTINEIVEAVVSAFTTSKLFRTPTV